MQTYTRGALTFDITDAGPSDAADDHVVVLLHGFPQNRHEWTHVAGRLNDAGYRTLAPDQRGYSPGARPRGRRAYVQSELVADVVALLDAAGLERVHLVGHDWGALVAWAFASRHPDRLHTLTTISVPHPKAFTYAMPRGQLRKSWYMGLFQLPIVPEAFIPTERGVRLIGGHGLTPDQVRAYLEPLGRDGLTAALNWYRALPWSQREKGYAHRSSVPTTYIWSDGDVALGRVGAEATANYVTGPYTFEVLEGYSHWLADEAPDEVADAILRRVAAD